jgi:ribosomal protein S18 acetylase RimI-like enzyme
MVSLARPQAGGRAIRPMNPFRDWNAVSQLLRVVFQSDVSSGSLPILPDWPWLRRLTPVINFFELLGMDAPEQMLGYVWEEDGRIVGNATLGLADAQRSFWLLSNVAVHPSYRRRGIARALVDTVLEETRRHGGAYLTLQVHTDNVGARALYERTGFRTVEHVSELVGANPSLQALPAAGWQLRPPTQAQWAEVRALISAHLPAGLSGYRHSIAGLFDVPFQRDWLGLAGDLLRGTQVANWCLLNSSGAVAGGMVAQAHLSWGTHRVGAFVSPAAAGLVEPLLLGAAAEHIQRYASRRVQFVVPASYLALSERLRMFGFREARTLELMTIAL